MNDNKDIPSLPWRLSAMSSRDECQGRLYTGCSGQERVLASTSRDSSRRHTCECMLNSTTRGLDVVVEARMKTYWDPRTALTLD